MKTCITFANLQNITFLLVSGFGSLTSYGRKYAIHKKNLLFVFLITVMSFSSFVSYGQMQNDVEIEQKIIEQLPTVLKSIKAETNVVVINEKHFQSVSNSKIADFRRTSTGLDSYVSVEILYSTYQIKYSYFKKDELLNTITKNF